MDYCVETSNSLDILCQDWTPLPKSSPEQRITIGYPVRSLPEEELPSWISLISRSAFGEPHDILGGRVHGDSFVGAAGLQGRQIYNASGDLRSWAIFGRSGKPKLTEPQSPSHPPQSLSQDSTPTIHLSGIVRVDTADFSDM